MLGKLSKQLNLTECVVSDISQQPVEIIGSPRRRSFLRDRLCHSSSHANGFHGIPLGRRQDLSPSAPNPVAHPNHSKLTFPMQTMRFERWRKRK